MNKNEKQFSLARDSVKRKFLSFYLPNTLQIFPIIAIFLTVAPVALSEPNISILWEKDITRADRRFKPYAIKVDEDKYIVRLIAVSYGYKPKEKPRLKTPELFEYRVNLKDNTSEMKTLMAMDGNDIAITMLDAILDSRLIGNNIVMIRSQYKSTKFPELSIGNDWQVKAREIPGLTRPSVSTHGACRNMNGEVFLCGDSGYIRKVNSDGNVAWDRNYKSDKGEDGTSSVAFSEADNMLVAFGFSFEPDTKFTTKNSSLWLANIDSEGNFRAKTEFEGIANFGKSPSFCLSKSGNPIVIYDNNAEIGSYKIYASKFSKELNTKVWTAHLFDGKDMMMAKMSLIPLENDYMLALLSSFLTKDKYSSNLHFYILDNNGRIANKTVFTDIEGVGANCLAAVFKDKIFLISEGYPDEKDRNTHIAKLLCFKMNPS